MGGKGGRGCRVAAGADEERSHTLVLHVFVLTVSEAQSPPRNAQDHQTTHCGDSRQDHNTGKMFSFSSREQN